MDVDERYRQGRELILDVWGQAYGGEILRRLQGLAPELERQIVEFMYGHVWSRPAPPGPDRKTRSLATIAVLSALNRAHQLRVHIVGALNNGATEAEIVDILLMTGLLAGFPSAWDSLIQAKQVFEEYRGGAFHQAGRAAAAADASFEE